VGVAEAVDVAVGELVTVPVEVAVVVEVGKGVVVWNWGGVAGKVAVGGPNVRVETAVGCSGTISAVGVAVGVSVMTAGNVGGAPAPTPLSSAMERAKKPAQ
jgi:hypothetical protein